tara:strand:- start:211 stop:555 length:345 start_codon:yes stop_codon:yes gene_type:complete
MSTLQQNIKDLIFFYVKINYEDYLEINKLKTIPDSQINEVVSKLYFQRKEHIKQFILDSLKQMLKEEYPGDQTVKNILLNIFQDDDFCQNRLIIEIKMHQQNITNGTIDYSKLL